MQADPVAEIMMRIFLKVHSKVGFEITGRSRFILHVLKHKNDENTYVENFLG